MANKSRFRKLPLHAKALECLAGVDLLDAECAGHFALGQIADKWTFLLVYALRGGPKRHAELKRQLPGISTKMLIQNLRKLEVMEFVAREVYPEVPPRVEYRLTPLGDSFLEPLAGICRWAKERLPLLRQVRARIQAKADKPSAAPRDPKPKAPLPLRKLAGMS